MSKNIEGLPEDNAFNIHSLAALLVFANQMATTAIKHVDMVTTMLQFKLSVRMVKKYNSGWLLPNLKGSVRIWCQQLESMNPSCLSMVQVVGGVMVRRIFSWHTLGLSSN